MTAIEIENATKQQKYIKTLKELRAKNFSRNLPFLILSDKLPEGQVYREFSDGRIEMQEVYTEGSTFRSKVVKTLTTSEAEKVREEYGLF